MNTVHEGSNGKTELKLLKINIVIDGTSHAHLVFTLTSLLTLRFPPLRVLIQFLTIVRYYCFQFSHT